MSSPESRAVPLDRVFWQEEGWQKLAAHFSRGAAIHSPPACPPSQPKRTASHAGFERSPPALSTTGSSSSLQSLRRRKRARMSSHEEPSTGVETGSSRVMMERISELSRRLSVASTASPGHLSAVSTSTATSTASTVSPLHDKTNVRRAEAKKANDTSRSEKGGTRTSPVKPVRSLGRTYSGSVGYKPAALRHQPTVPLPAPAWRLQNVAPIKEERNKLSADLGDADDELDGDDSFDLLLSQVPDIDVVFGSASPCNPKASQEAAASHSQPVGETTITKEAANDLCAGILEWSDLEEI